MQEAGHTIEVVERFERWKAKPLRRVRCATCGLEMEKDKHGTNWSGELLRTGRCGA